MTQRNKKIIVGTGAAIAILLLLKYAFGKDAKVSLTPSADVNGGSGGGGAGTPVYGTAGTAGTSSGSTQTGGVKPIPGTTTPVLTNGSNDTPVVDMPPKQIDQDIFCKGVACNGSGTQTPPIIAIPNTDGYPQIYTVEQVGASSYESSRFV